ncbi:hypothetical protein A8926_5212 [Saccharopolyspora spinosa]|uniref:Uncharacterized protein n=2 Tax=Saccharopolyspora spinosa TaxID=60894 RepID=A0A2N3Y2W0_SACSN|nr:hypothetical protein A8926_5212 [Saccharopolyspora spinosa]
MRSDQPSSSYRRILFGCYSRPMLELTSDSAREELFHDCFAWRAAEAVSLLRLSNPVGGGQGVRAAAWRGVPVTFDRLPELVSASVVWDEIEVVELPTGLCPNWSRPGLVAALLVGLARSSG